jgi:hypothetical protein
MAPLIPQTLRISLPPESNVRRELLVSVWGEAIHRSAAQLEASGGPHMGMIIT